VALLRVYLRSLIVLFACVVCWAPSVFAQVVTDPQLVEFDPSPDHSAVSSSGLPVVDRYDLAIFEVGVPTPYKVISLGKPAPQSDGKIRLDLMALLTQVPPALVIYDAQVSVIGPTGTAASNYSNEFEFSGPCGYTVTTGSLASAFPPSGGSATIDVSAGTGCSWSAGSGAPWATLSASGGSGSGTVGLIIAANTASTGRSTTINVASHTFTVTQAAASTGCSYSISSSTTSFTAAGGDGSINVIAPAGCAWTALSSSAWLTVSGGSSGNGTVTFAVAPNPSTSRSASVMIADQSVTIMQAGGTCSYSLSSTTTSFSAAGGNGSIGVTAPAGCQWTPVSSATWLALGEARSGSGTLTFTVAPNSSTSSRSATVTFGSASISVTQAAVACTYSVSATGTAFSAAGGTGKISVTAASGCAWTPVSSAPWVVTGDDRVGTASAGFTVAANSSSLSRSASIDVAGEKVSITQSGAACSVSVSSSTKTFSSSGGNGSVNVSAAEGCSWTPVSNAAWLTVGSGGSGSGSLGFTVAPSGAGASRSATLRIANQSIAITEAGGACTVSLSSTSQTFPASGGSATITVTASEGCFWNPGSDATWLTLQSAGGVGTGTVSYAVAANRTSSTRSAVLSVGGALLEVAQEGKRSGRIF
jgi:hypothetical protein